MPSFENRDPETAVTLAAESAVREIVGKQDRLGALRAARCVATQLVQSIQLQLDRLKTGILVVNVNVQSVQPPEQVQAAFEDTLKAGQDGDRLKKEGQAYASSEIPKAQGTSARLRQEAEGYKARVIAQAEGDAERFARQLVEYQKAPQVTRDRLYIDAMREVYSNITKVMIDAHNKNSPLSMPLDRLLQAAAVGPAAGRRGRRPRRARPRRPASTSADVARATTSTAASATAGEERAMSLGSIVGGFLLLALASSTLFIIDQRRVTVVSSSARSRK